MFLRGDISRYISYTWTVFDGGVPAVFFRLSGFFLAFCLSLRINVDTNCGNVLHLAPLTTAFILLPPPPLEPFLASTPVGAGEPRAQLEGGGGDQYRGRLSGSREGRDNRVYREGSRVSRHWVPRGCSANERGSHAS